MPRRAAREPRRGARPRAARRGPRPARAGLGRGGSNRGEAHRQRGARSRQLRPGAVLAREHDAGRGRLDDGPHGRGQRRDGRSPARALCRGGAADDPARRRGGGAHGVERRQPGRARSRLAAHLSALRAAGRAGPRRGGAPPRVPVRAARLRADRPYPRRHARDRRRRAGAGLQDRRAPRSRPDEGPRRLRRQRRPERRPRPRHAGAGGREDVASCWPPSPTPRVSSSTPAARSRPARPPRTCTRSSGRPTGASRRPA